MLFTVMVQWGKSFSEQTTVTKMNFINLMSFFFFIFCFSANISKRLQFKVCSQLYVLSGTKPHGLFYTAMYWRVQI